MDSRHPHHQYAARMPLFLLAMAMTVLPLLGHAPTIARQAFPRESPGTPAFQRTWERTDQPVIDGSTSRTWMWGPDAFTSVLTEEYSEAGGSREVQYFDKSRMEITHPDAVDDGLWYVTNGLLVVELISGRMQVGDDAFVDRAPAQVPVAGDSDDPTGPTYATFADLLDAPPRDDGATIYERVDRDGNLTEDPALAVHNVISAQLVQVPGISHQVAGPFWDFMNSKGIVYQNGVHSEDQLFINPFYATGYPITEAYWASVEVAGTYRDVLMQCFERRCLTYTPGNPPGFLTEAGNVGQHYYTWRYAQPADSLVINETLYDPDPEAEQTLAFVELFNPTADLRDLSGAILTNSDGSHRVELPAWALPPGAFLVVYFGDGANDADISDGSASYFFNSGSDPFFSIEQDAVALYGGEPSGDEIIDFVAWSAEGVYDGGVAQDHAVSAGIWTAGTFYDAGSGPIEPQMADYAMRVPVVAGSSIGRDASGHDNDAPADFAQFGGLDAVVASPGASNQNSIDDLFIADEAPAAFAGGAGILPRGARPRQPQPAPLPRKTWTIMVYMDGRDDDLRKAWMSDINKMERVGSNANINIVVEFLNPGASSGRLQRYYVEKETTDSIKNPVQTIDDVSKTNPGDPAALAAFIDWAEHDYPASHYAIVLAGHGDGWKGTLISGDRGDHLTMSEVDTGLAALGTAQAPLKFDVLVWYSCLMGQTEVAYQMQKHATYMIASEEITWSNTVPWQGFVGELQTNLDWTNRQFAVRFALLWADALESNASSRRAFTMAAIDLAIVRPDLANALDAFSTQLEGDIDTIINNLDDPQDNVQIKVKKGAREPAETFTDKNFIDAYHFAELVKKLGIPSSALAQPVMDAVLNSTPVIRRGVNHPNANGLSIYFPHDSLQPRESAKWGRAFDDPLHDPYDSKITTDGTHYYKHDSKLLVPKLQPLEYPFKDDPKFDFPNSGNWDEMLHRYYKPVADACIRFGGDCVKEATVAVGTTVTLSGNGSSDSDGREGPSNDLPAHNLVPAPANQIYHYYWDFQPGVDTGGVKPDYADNHLYKDCDGEDCDRDDIDETDDDLDAKGKTVPYTCAAEGEFPIRFMVWDEHHDEDRSRIENIRVNKGKHWLQFNVDDSSVLVKCVKEKKSDPERVPPDNKFQYVIKVIPNPALTGPADGTMSDPLPAGVNSDGIPTCTSGQCSYDATSRTVRWAGTLQPGQVVEIRIPVRLPPGEPPVPPEIVNCATIYDGVISKQACATTTIGEPIAHLEKEATVATIVPGEAFDWTLVLTADSGLEGPSDATIVDPLPNGIVLAGEVECSSGSCGVDEISGDVIWSGVLSPEAFVEVTIHALFPLGQSDYPDTIENCATFAVDPFGGQACETTPVESAEEPAEGLTKTASLEMATQGDTIHYTIRIPYVGDGEQATAADLIDTLPEFLAMQSDVLCSSGECDFDEELGEVHWTGSIQVGEIVTVEFDSLLVPTSQEPPPLVENCADYSDENGQTDRACATTAIIIE